MKIVASILIALCLGAASSTGQSESRPESFDDSIVSAIEYPAWFKQSFLDLPEDLAEAEIAGKKGIMLIFGTEGCSYCKALVDRVLSNPELSNRIQTHFDTMALEMFSDTGMTDLKGASMPVKEFARQQGAEFSPTVIFYDTAGKRMFRVVGYYPIERFRLVLEYVIGDHYLTQTYRSFVTDREKAHQNAGRRSASTLREEVSEPVRATDRRDVAKRPPMVVVFEKKHCPECQRFRDEVLSDLRIESALKGFKTLRLDIASETLVITPGGRRLKAGDWANTLGFAHMPAIALFDEKGALVLKTDAPLQRQRMENALKYVYAGAYYQGITYQRFLRNRATKVSIE